MMKGDTLIMSQIYGIITQEVNDMAKKKSLKMKNYMNHHPMLGTLENGVLEWMCPDDISIVGVLLWVECSTFGMIRLAEVSLAGSFSTDVSTAAIEEESDKKVLIFGADKSYALTPDMPQSPVNTIWFGRDLAVDVDENEIVYVHQYGTVAGNGMTRVIIYYIER